MYGLLAIAAAPVLARGLLALPAPGPAGPLTRRPWAARVLVTGLAAIAAGVGAGAAAFTAMLGASAIALLGLDASGPWEFIPMEPAALAVAWLGGVLAIDLGLSALFTREMPWRRSDRVTAMLLGPGLTLLLGLCGLVGRHPAQEVVPWLVVELGLPLLGLIVGVALLGPLRPLTRRLCQAGALALAVQMYALVLLSPGTAASSAPVLILVGLYVWHALAGPVVHRC